LADDPSGRHLARLRASGARCHDALGAGTDCAMTRAHSSGLRPSATIAPERRESLLRAAPSELAVQYRPIESLAPYRKNPRTHSEAQIDQIAASIREYGWTNPVLVDGEQFGPPDPKQYFPK
jgi:hypothetical protein